MTNYFSFNSGASNPSNYVYWTAYTWYNLSSNY